MEVVQLKETWKTNHNFFNFFHVLENTSATSLRIHAVQLENQDRLGFCAAMPDYAQKKLIICGR